MARVFPGTTGAHRTARTVTTFLVSTTTMSYACHFLAGCVGVSRPELTDSNNDPNQSLMSSIMSA